MLRRGSHKYRLIVWLVFFPSFLYDTAKCFMGMSVKVLLNASNIVALLFCNYLPAFARANSLVGRRFLTQKRFDERVYVSSERTRRDQLFDLYSSLQSAHLTTVAHCEPWPARGLWYQGVCWYIGPGRTIAFSLVEPPGTASPSTVWGG